MISEMFNFKPREFNKIGISQVLSSNAMVCASHPFASSIGIEILKNGGNAVDAALAMNAVLCIAEPHMTGIGGDCFAMISKDGSNDIRALNGSGKSSQNSSAINLRNKNISFISSEMPDAITIPGAVAGWSLLHKQYGHIPWKELFNNAINFAEKGIRVHERVALDWSNNTKKLSLDNDTSDLFLRNGKSFKFKDNFKNIKLSETLRTIADEGFNGFYNGWVVEDMVSKLNSIGGVHTKKDFNDTKAEWVKPISRNYRNVRIYECPPNGQGLVALIILAILEKFNVSKMSKVDFIHCFCEATKIGYYLRDQFLADPEYNKLTSEQFLKSDQIEEYYDKIDMKKSKFHYKSCFPDHQDTIYLTVRDKDGMTISFINSIFDQFGSGITAPKSGILFHSRGRAFNLIKGHPNELAPCKRPLHTIIPAMITKNDKLIASFGVMGGQYQAAGHAYVISKIFDNGLSPQDAINFPRVFPNNNELDIENGFDEDVINNLLIRGHKINYPSQAIGGAQFILIDDNCDLLIGASDWRKDGCALGY